MTMLLAVHGAAGRMGRRVVALASGDERFELVAAIDHETHPDLGRDAGVLAGGSDLGVALSPQWPERVDVVIDFSLPQAVPGVLRSCVRGGCPLVIATTGIEPEDIERIHEASKTIPVVWAPSMSLAVNLAMRLTAQTARALRGVPGGVDVEIIERHHRFKEDAPSGTAITLAEQILKKHEHKARWVQHPPAQDEELLILSHRVDEVPGTHIVRYHSDIDTMEIKHEAHNRKGFASGALLAAEWVVGKQGIYSMQDVLQL